MTQPQTNQPSELEVILVDFGRQMQRLSPEAATQVKEVYRDAKSKLELLLSTSQREARLPIKIGKEDIAEIVMSHFPNARRTVLEEMTNELLELTQDSKGV